MHVAILNDRLYKQNQWKPLWKVGVSVAQSEPNSSDNFNADLQRQIHTLSGLGLMECYYNLYVKFILQNVY
jgi:hypothetical protein